MTPCSVVSDSLCLCGMCPPGSSVHPIFKQEYCSGLPFPTLGHLPEPGNQTCVSSVSCVAGGFLPLEPCQIILVFVWLTSLIVMIPRSIHAATNGIISFFLMAE